MEKIKEYINKRFEEDSLNTHLLNKDEEALRVYCTLCNSLYKNTDVQAAINWEGDRITFEYEDLMDRIIDSLSVKDFGSNYVHTEFKAFVSWSVEDIHKRKINQLTAKKQDRLLTIKKEQHVLQKELDKLLQGEK